MMLSHDKQHFVNTRKKRTLQSTSWRERLEEDATNNTSNQVVNRQRDGNDEGGISSLNKCSTMPCACAAIFIYSDSLSYNIQLFTIEVSSFATER